ncbi:MAG: glutaredoxin 3 [Thiohalocapsa sp. PB-PSB1]|jgi:glutaredoxin 3|nr:MAG: hypothetical protein N838_18920 [Thiohalocapsa sp. PB-PSB1]QQO54398.1 MAG: glutaredoxin 3 [Thiohalocapsa sp. PB-PSB1]HCS89744.1 glutaredoxin 3 [Chromatiaceae bacterium]
MPLIQIYTTAFCPYCVRALDLLDRKQIKYQQIRVDRDREQLKAMIRRSNRTTVPQIFIGEYHVGGYDDIVALEQTGELDRLLEEPSIRSSIS